MNQAEYVAAKREAMRLGNNNFPSYPQWLKQMEGDAVRKANRQKIIEEDKPKPVKPTKPKRKMTKKAYEAKRKAIAEGIPYDAMDADLALLEEQFKNQK